MVVPCSRAVLGVCRHAKIQSLIAQWSFLYPTSILETPLRQERLPASVRAEGSPASGLLTWFGGSY